MRIESQNILGSRKLDLLRATDWLFPRGMNHHELFAGVPAVQPVMQAFARRVAGLGRLPREVVPPREAARVKRDVLVVGAGPSGMAMAVAAARRGRTVHVVDENAQPGGILESLPSTEASDGLRAAFDQVVASGAVTLALRTLAAGVFGDDVLLVGEALTEACEARAVVFATGTHDGSLAFANNDLPGVMSARAAGLLLRYGILPGRAPVVVAMADLAAEVERSYGSVAGLAAGSHSRESAGAAVRIVQSAPSAALGSNRVEGVEVDGETLGADALVLDVTRSPAYELCAQAGARVRHVPQGFVVRPGTGVIRPGFFAIGEVTGEPLDVPRFVAKAEELVARL
jgi:sarcosine oxidase subunit alpha